MRKLLSVAALLVASTLTLWQPEPALASTKVVIVAGHHRHHVHYRHYHYRHGYYR
jgi:hypothetical protein